MSSLLGVYDRDLVVVSGRGSYLFDSEGRKYLDFAAGVGVNGLGYGDRKVVAAIRKQAGQLIHASNLYHTETGAALADRLVSLAFPSRVFFCNSGTEAMEAAIKFARRIGKPAGRTALVAFEGSFHGRTMGSLSLTWTAKYREPFEPLIPGVRFCAWNDLDAARQAVGEDTAAVVVEPVQGEGGVRPAPPAFLKGLSELCRERGALLVADEIQCGLGRTGKLFAHQHAGIVPDILTLAKPLGGGLPLGAVLLREELASEIKPGDHGSTFGGNPVALAASMAVIDRLTSPAFVDKVARKGEAMRRGLRRIAKRLPGSIADVRGLGLMIGTELTFAPAPVLKALRARGVLATRAGENVVRALPPLTVSGKEIRAYLEAFEAALTEVVASRKEPE
jgi:acetylornithine/N-succinyldiaminopimelate aminotransferase